MSPEKLLDDETGWKGAPYEFIHSKMYGMVIAPHKAANIWDGNCPILRENWDGMMPHRRKGLKCEKK